MPVLFYSSEEFRALKAEVITLQQKLEVAEALRPHWAQGYSSDSIAAQTATAALSQIWGLLDVTNQTDCMEKLRALQCKQL